MRMKLVTNNNRATGEISQELMAGETDDTMTRISGWVVNTREVAIKQALSQLGWAAPEAINEIINQVQADEREQCANVCDYYGVQYPTVRVVADAIRARSGAPVGPAPGQRIDPNCGDASLG